MLSKPTVGIVGASGFIGSRLVEWLVLHDFANVRPIVRSFMGMARLARFVLDCRVADAVDRVALEEELRGCEVLFHCVVGDRDTILQSAAAAYQAATGAGVRRLVYLSSAVVHGHDPYPGTNDDSELVASQPFDYNVSKVMAEHLLRQLRADGAVEVVTLRPCIVFGPRSTWWTAQIAAGLLSGTACLVDGGAGICNTVYVDNLAQAMWLAAICDRAANQDFIITDGERVTWLDLYRAVAEAVGVDLARVPSIDSAALPSEARGLESNQAKTGTHVFPVVDRDIASLQCCRYVLPTAKARELLGYVPEVTFSEGCRRTREWLRFAFAMDGNGARAALSPDQARYAELEARYFELEARYAELEARYDELVIRHRPFSYFSGILRQLPREASRALKRRLS